MQKKSILLSLSSVLLLFVLFSCGNKKVDPGETCSTCPADVWVCLPSCGDGKINTGTNIPYLHGTENDGFVSFPLRFPYKF